MSFIQIIEYRTSKPDAVADVSERWDKATVGKRTVRRRVLCRDRNDTNRYYNVVFFDSYESAMENSRLPETQSLSEEMMSMVDGPATFHDLDVIDDQS
jgi:hypothetical protein